MVVWRGTLSFHYADGKLGAWDGARPVFCEAIKPADVRFIADLLEIDFYLRGRLFLFRLPGAGDFERARLALQDIFARFLGAHGYVDTVQISRQTAVLTVFAGGVPNKRIWLSGTHAFVTASGCYFIFYRGQRRIYSFGIHPNEADALKRSLLEFGVPVHPYAQ